MEFGKKFKIYLTGKGLTAKEYGQATQYSPQVMSKYSNVDKPNIDFVDTLVQFDPEVDLNELLKDEAILKLVAERKAERLRAATAALEDLKKNIEIIEDGLSRI